MEISLRAPAVTPPPSARPPGGTLPPDEVLALHDELLASHAAFAPHFRRAEQRHWALKYTEGQLLPLERKSIEPMADALDGGNVQAMQQCVGLGVLGEVESDVHGSIMPREARGCPVALGSALGAALRLGVVLAVVASS